ncbi:MAG: hypothetical protein ACLUIQ_03520 [Dialister invisus]
MDWHGACCSSAERIKFISLYGEQGKKIDWELQAERESSIKKKTSLLRLKIIMDMKWYIMTTALMEILSGRFVVKHAVKAHITLRTDNKTNTSSTKQRIKTLERYTEQTGKQTVL